MKNHHYSHLDVICECAQVKRSEIEGNRREDRNLRGAMCASGAGTVCTMCRPLVADAVSEENIDWIEVSVVRKEQTGEGVALFTLSLERPLKHYRPGQHFLIQGKITGRRYTRRYTIVDYDATALTVQIMVKKEKNGIFSSWIHDDTIAMKQIRVSDPVGEEAVSLADETAPLVCIAGGIGVTPALAFVRSLMNGHHNRPIHLLHAVSDERQVISPEILRTYESENPLLHIEVHNSKVSGRIGKEKINELLATYQDASFHICGPERFTEEMIHYLRESGVDADRIYGDYFSLSGEETQQFSSAYFYVGVTLLILYVLQAWLGLKFSLLETWQHNEIYKVYSGVFVVLFLAWQFIRPYNKACENPRFFNTYKAHKWAGAFAPLVFYVHATDIGVGYLVLLSMVYFSNVIAGLFNHERFKEIRTRTKYYRYWLPVHIILSLLTVAMTAIHIYVVGAY